MNKIYKTVWNAVRQQFVVADEAQNTTAACRWTKPKLPGKLMNT